MSPPVRWERLSSGLLIPVSLILAFMRTESAQAESAAAGSAAISMDSLLINRLNQVARDQQAFKSRTGRFASSAAELMLGEDGNAGRDLVIVFVSKRGWSAVARDSTSGTLRCALSWGDAPPLLSTDSSPKIPVCRGAAPPPHPVFGGDTAVVAEELVSNPPELVKCGSFLNETGVRQGHATLHFVIGTDGLAEAKFSVTDATDFLLVIPALYAIYNCKYVPGSIGGTLVRVLVAQRINFN
jgi:hypothetical protein